MLDKVYVINKLSTIGYELDEVLNVLNETEHCWSGNCDTINEAIAKIATVVWNLKREV